MTTYRIVRMYAHPSIVSEWIDTGLTLEEAQEHCKDPETSSKTATHIKNTTLTKTFGDWLTDTKKRNDMRQGNVTCSKCGGDAVLMKGDYIFGIGLDCPNCLAEKE